MSRDFQINGESMVYVKGPAGSAEHRPVERSQLKRCASLRCQLATNACTRSGPAPPDVARTETLELALVGLTSPLTASRSSPAVAARSSGPRAAAAAGPILPRAHAARCLTAESLADSTAAASTGVAVAASFPIRPSSVVAQ